MSSAPPQMIDPLAALIAHEFRRDRRLLPLVDLAFDIEIAGGLALVRTVRSFHHSEENSLEAILVFPVPLRAALFSLEVEIEGRRLKARAVGRAEARDDYEEAITSGRTTVLHEEVLRGVHMLSIGHLPPNRPVVVETAFAMPLAADHGHAALRIPLTVGEIYGDPHLPETDVPEHAPSHGRARLRVRCQDARVWLAGKPIHAEEVEVPLDAPIDLRLEGWTPAPVVGRTADGRRVVVDIRPEKVGEDALDMAILLDRSGSMGELVSGSGSRGTKHDAAVRGLLAVAERLERGDIVELWEFDDRCECLGSTRGSAKSPRHGRTSVTRRFRQLVAGLGGPRGGTELGDAIARVLRDSPCRDLLVITDGKSWALDVDDFVRCGKRISAVLVGEDSLEAMIGHLAALTGGDLQVTLDGTVEEGLSRAIAQLRSPHRPPAIEGDLDGLDTVISGMRVSARWPCHPLSDGARQPFKHAVAALAASLALPALAPERARQLALAESLVSHHTSLVLVDEEGEAHEGLPHTVKIPLATPRTAFRLADGCFAPVGPRRIWYSRRAFDSLEMVEPLRSLSPFEARGEAVGIDWMREAPRLLRGDFSGLDAALAEAIRAFAEEEDVIRLARRLGIAPVLMVLCLLADAWADRDRFARRLAHKLLPSPTPGERAEIERLQRTLLSGIPALTTWWEVVRHGNS